MIAIARRENEFGEVRILKYRLKEHLYYVQDGYFQTETDRGGISLAPYIHAIYGLIVQAEARNVLMIGCGGGSLGTMLAKAAILVTIVDKNPVSFEIARDYFSLPNSVDCQVADGREFLLTTSQRYDAIVLDAYDGSFIPHHLRTAEFLRLVQTRLDRSRGCFLANIHALHDQDRDPDLLAAAAKRAWNDVRLLDTRGVGSRNALVIAGAVGKLGKPTLLMPPASEGAEIAIGLKRMNFRSWHP